jgi:anti-anti-sigma factor
LAEIQLKNNQLVISGELDKAAVSQLARNSVSLTSGETYQLNLSEVDHIDSAGLAFLVNLICQQQRSGGDIRISAMTEQLNKLIELSDVAMLFQQ